MTAISSGTATHQGARVEQIESRLVGTGHQADGLRKAFCPCREIVLLPFPLGRPPRAALAGIRGAVIARPSDGFPKADAPLLEAAFGPELAGREVAKAAIDQMVGRKPANRRIVASH